MRNLVCVVIVDSSSSTGVRVVNIQAGAKHSHQLRPAPPGFQPGDEKFMSYDGKNLTIDLPGHHKEFEQRHAHAAAEHHWNNASPVERMKAKFKKGNP